MYMWLFTVLKCKEKISCFYTLKQIFKSIQNGSPTIRDRDVSGVGISDRSGLRYRRFGTSVPTVREFDFSRLLINKYEKKMYFTEDLLFVLLWFFGCSVFVHVIWYQNEHLIE